MKRSGSRKTITGHNRLISYVRTYVRSFLESYSFLLSFTLSHWQSSSQDESEFSQFYMFFSNNTSSPGPARGSDLPPPLHGAAAVLKSRQAEYILQEVLQPQ